MNQDPSAVGRARVAAETFAQVANSFVEEISWKTLVNLRRPEKQLITCCLTDSLLFAGLYPNFPGVFHRFRQHAAVSVPVKACAFDWRDFWFCSDCSTSIHGTSCNVGSPKLAACREHVGSTRDTASQEEYTPVMIIIAIHVTLFFPLYPEHHAEHEEIALCLSFPSPKPLSSRRLFKD